MSDEVKKDYKGKDPMSPEKITSHELTAVSRDPEDINEGVAESTEESKERLRRSVMTKGADKSPIFLPPPIFQLLFQILYC